MGFLPVGFLPVILMGAYHRTHQTMIRPRHIADICVETLLSVMELDILCVVAYLSGCIFRGSF